MGVSLPATEGAAPRAVVVARLDLEVPRSGSGWCRVLSAERAPRGREAEAPGVLLRSPRPRAVQVVRGARTLFEVPAGTGASAVAVTALRGDERVVLLDPEGHEPPSVLQLPALVPQIDLLPSGGAPVSVELAVEALEIDLERGALALHWRGLSRPLEPLAGLREDDIAVRGGFGPGAPAAEIAMALAEPRRSPLSAVPIEGDTRFERTTFPWPAAPSRDVLVIVVKGTFDLVAGEPARLAAEQAALSGERLHEGGSSLEYPGDFVPPKPRADVLVKGHACAKPGARVARVEVRVGEVVAEVVAMGPRSWLAGGRPGEPAPFERVPLRYEHAFGGGDVAENPAGTGASPGSEPPSIELPGALLRAKGDRVPPAGLGPIGRDWAPRRGLLGTFTKEWAASRWPCLPADFDPAFWNAAPAALTAAALRGDEGYRITSVLPGGGDVSGSLPGLSPVCLADRNTQGVSRIPLRLDTVMFDTDAGKLHLVWRGMIELDGERGELRRLVLLSEPIAAPLPAAELQRRVAATAGAPGKTTLPRAAPAPLLLGVKAPPRASRSQVERWLAAGESLAGRDLSGADLSGMDLSGRDLSGAILRGTILDGARLDRVNAVGLRGAGLVARRSRWVGARLDRADLAGAQLEGADLTEASLAAASLGDADLAGLVARRISAASAQLFRARMAGAILEDARLEKVDLSGATLDEARLEGACLDDAKLYEALGEGLVADRASMVDARMEGAQLDGASFQGVKGTGSMWERASLAGADFAAAELAGASFAGASLARARMAGADLSGARLPGADLSGASFARANLMRATLEGATATGADFTGANLYQVETWRARMAGAKLAGALRRGTKLP